MREREREMLHLYYSCQLICEPEEGTLRKLMGQVLVFLVIVDSYWYPSKRGGGDYVSRPSGKLVGCLQNVLHSIYIHIESTLLRSMC